MYFVHEDKNGPRRTWHPVGEANGASSKSHTNSGAVGNEERSRTPLAESRIEVVEQPGRPGAYSAVAHLRPWLQLEELTTSVRMVTKIPG